MSLTCDPTMVISFTQAEMKVIGELAQLKDLSEPSIIRQALRLYQLIEVRRASCPEFEQKFQELLSLGMLPMVKHEPFKS